MNTQTISIEFPSDIFLTLNESEEELEQQLRVLFAARLYYQQKVTIGKAAQIAGLKKLEFENWLAENEIPISNLSYDDILKDAEKLC
jgi:predicted HTH domain antitoxin